MTSSCLQLEPRIDAATASKYSAEVGSYVFHNLHLVEIWEYCQRFDKICPKPSQ